MAPDVDGINQFSFALAAILTAIGTLIGVIFAWVKWRAEIRGLRAEFQPTLDDPEPTRALPAEPASNAPGTLRDVTNSSHQMLMHLVNQVDGLTATDSRIEAWGRSEHQRIEGRVEDLEFRVVGHEERLSAIEGGQ